MKLEMEIAETLQALVRREGPRKFAARCIEGRRPPPAAACNRNSYPDRVGESGGEQLT